MLDLDILLKNYSAISQIPLIRQPEDPSESPAAFYGSRIDVEEGCAGYLVTDEFLFVGKIVQRGSGICILLGPTAETPVTREIVSRISRQMKLNAAQTRNLQASLQKYPTAPLADFLKLLGFLNYVINENDSLPSRQPVLEGSAPQAFTGNADAVVHNTSELEDFIIRSIEFGDREGIARALEQSFLDTYTMGNVSSDSLRALKNVIVTCATLGCRAAVRGGLDYDVALTLSDDYIRRSEQIQTYHSFARLFRQMLTELTERVADLQLRADCSELVRDTARIISGHIGEKITAAQLARELRVSVSYLSHRFKRETGMSITDYITQQKIREAKRLLETTELSLAQIAYQLSFSSQSYFHAVFKKVTGISPGKYPR